MSEKDKIISEAEGFLVKQPFDAAHDLEHHKKVASIALDIASHIEEPVDIESVQIAAMWHDVVTEPVEKPDVADRNAIKERTCKYLEEQLTSAGYDSEFVERTVTAVRYHSFEDEPKNTEGEVLYDADKLSALDFTRWQKIIKAHEAGLIPDSQFNAYVEAGKKWIESMQDKLHFEYSKEIYKEKMKQLLENDWAQNLAKLWGVKLEDYA